MLRTLKTFNAHNINDNTSYTATVLNPFSLPPAKPVFVSQGNSDSEDTGVYTVDVQTIAVSIKIRNYASRVTLAAQLQQWFKRGTLGNLVVTYSDDGVDYYKPCRVVNLIQDPTHSLYFTAILNTGWTAWRAVTASTNTWNLSGTGGNNTITLLGDDEAPLSVTFSLTAGPANGYLYQKLYQLINAPQTVPALGYGPWCITLDTASLIADNANKCQINNVAGITAVATTIAYDTVTGTLPSAGSGYVDTEQISWTGKTGTTSGNLTGVTRGIGGTTAATHADNAVIKLSYMQAGCNDLRIFLDGKETNRWIASPNNASTKVWFNLTMNKGYSLALKTAIASAGSISYIEFAVNPNVLSALTAMPVEGILVHGTEWIKYKGKDLANYRLVVTARGVLGTTLQAHAAADVFTYMEHVIAICYGNFTIAAPDANDTTYDNTKPVFVLSSSTNSSWVYDATSIFIDKSVTGRTGGWVPVIYAAQGKNTGLYGIYYLKRGAGPDPAMGMHISPYYKGTTLLADNASIGFVFYRACGIDTTTFTGEKYSSSVIFPSVAALQSSSDGALYTTLWNEAVPASLSTWTALGTHSSVAMSSVRWMRFLFEGTTDARLVDTIFEVHTGTINFVSANLPTGTIGAQQLSQQIDLVFSNGANSDAFQCVLPMLPGLTLALDGEAKTVLYNNVNAHSTILPNSDSRAWWIRLAPGSNTLTISSVDVGTMVASLSWYRRRL